MDEFLSMFFYFHHYRYSNSRSVLTFSHMSHLHDLLSKSRQVQLLRERSNTA